MLVVGVVVMFVVGFVRPRKSRRVQSVIDHVFFEGERESVFYMIMEGKVAISIRGAVVQYVGPGAVFGEMALIDQSPRAANAVAETDCALLAINRNVFLNLVKSEPSFGIALLSAMAERLRNTATALN